MTTSNTSGLSILVAAELSAAAYGGDNPIPDGWSQLYYPVSEVNTILYGVNSFTVYINSQTKQIVFAFKGSDNPGNFLSDFANDGGGAWESIKPLFEQELKSIQGNPYYNGYTIFTDGHSLGGGMAQTAALENNLSGYGQNALPVSFDAIYSDLNGLSGISNIKNLIAQWAINNSFTEVNVQGDPATLYYNLLSETDVYISTSTTTLSYPIAMFLPYVSFDTTSHLIGTVLTLLQDNAFALPSVNSTIIPYGFYFIQYNDTPQSISALTNSVLNENIDAATLLRINEPFGVNGFDPNTLLHVPISGNLLAGSNPLANFGLSAGLTQVYDPTNKTLYTVGSSLDGHDSGALIIDTPVFGGFATFDQGTYSSVNMLPNGDVSVSLVTPLGVSLGFLSFNASTDAGTYTLPDGLVIPISGGFAFHVTDPVETPEQVLLSYLPELGISDSVTQLDAANFDFLNPAPTSSNEVTGTVEKVDDNDANVYYTADQPGDIIAGQNTATITDYETVYDSYGDPYEVAYQVDAQATNYLSASGDISQDAISNIQELDISGNITLTETQFSQFDTIKGYGDLTAATGGNFDLSGSPDAYIYVLKATDWLGTTLIGNDTAEQELIASTFGNDTLIAGDGYSDHLYAGEGVDTLIGGNGGDTFFANYGLTAGTEIIGSGDNNVLEASGDISGASISGVQTLQLHGDITLNANEFTGFNNITNYYYNSQLTITAATGGTYNLSSNSTAAFNMTAMSNDGTNLIGDDADDETLTASAAGNDILIAGNGASDILNAGGGIDTLTGGSGGDTFNADSGLAAGSTVIGTGSNNLLEAAGDISGATVTGVQTLQVDGDITLNSDEFNGFTSIISYYYYYQYSYNWTITAATGGAYNLSSISNVFFNMIALSNDGTTLIGNDTGDETLTASESGNDELIAGNGGNNSLIAGDGNDTLIGGTGDGDLFYLGSGNDTIQINGNNNGIVFDTFNSASNYIFIDNNTNTDQSLSEDFIGNVVVSSSQLNQDALLQKYSTIYYEVDSGSTISDFVVSNIVGNSQEVIYSGGLAIGTTLYGNDSQHLGVQLVVSGGIADSTIVGSSGYEDIQSGGIASGTIVDSGGSIMVESGGTAIDIKVNSGGDATIYDDNFMNDITVESGGILTLTFSSETLVLGTENQSIQGVNLQDSAILDLNILSGASVSGFIVNSGGNEYIESGGIASGTILESQGYETDYGSSTGTIIGSGGQDDVQNGGVDSSTTVNSGGYLWVESGGTAIGVTVNSGGYANINDDNFVNDVTVESGGALTLEFTSETLVFETDNQSIQGITLQNGAILDLDIASGASEFGFIVNSGVSEYTESGGIASGTILESQGSETDYGSSIGTIVGSGGREFVQSGGMASGSTVENGGYLWVASGGTAIGITVNSGGYASINNNSFLNDDTVDSGGIINGLVLSSGSILAGAGDLVIDGVTIQSGAVVGLEIAAGASATGLILSASTTGLILNDSVTEIIDSGGAANSTTVDAGNTELVQFGGVASGSELFGSSSTNVLNGKTLVNPGYEEVYGEAISATINNYGYELVDRGGTAIDNSINSGGEEVVQIGGITNGTTINNGGYEFVSGTTSGAIINSGGWEFVYNGGVTNDVTVNSGGHEYVNSGGIANDTIISGGTLRFTGNVSSDQTVFFTGSGGTLKLDQPANFAGIISGFGVGDTIDLISATTISSVAWNNGGLSISLGSSGTVDLSLPGNFQSDSFNVASDNTGGTEITLESLPPTLSAVSYNTATAVFTFTGNNLLNAGDSITLSDLSLTGGISSYTFNSNDTVSNLTANSFTVTLSSTDQETVNAFVNANGGNPLNGAAYNLTAAGNWDNDSGLAITTQALTVTGVAATDVPQILQTAGLNTPTAIAVDNSGDVFLVNSSNNTVQEIAAGTDTVTTLLSGFHNPVTSITVDSAGDVFAFDSYHNSIVEVSAGTETVSTLTYSLYAPMGAGMTTDSKGDVFIAESNAVKEIVAGTHTLTTIATGFIMPQSIAIDNNGDLYVADTGHNAIKEIQAGTDKVITLVSGLNAPNGIAVDSAGNVYFADTKNGVIDEYAASTQSITTLATGLNSPTNMVLDNAGNLYADQSNGSIEEIAHTDYVFNTPLTGSNPTIISNLLENTGQIELSASVFTALAGEGGLEAANFSNAATATSSSDFIYYNDTTGGLYYEAGGSSGSSGVEFAVIGVNSHPTALSAGDFKVVA